MIVKNFLCNECLKLNVCKIYNTLVKFSEEAKKPLPVDITIDKCMEYKEVEE